MWQPGFRSQEHRDEDAYERSGEKFADTQYEILEVKNLKFEHYLRTAALNHGIIIGNTQLSDSDFKAWLSADFENHDQSKLLQLAEALLTLAGMRIALPNKMFPGHAHALREGRGICFVVVCSKLPIEHNGLVNRC